MSAATENFSTLLPVPVVPLRQGYSQSPAARIRTNPATAVATRTMVTAAATGATTTAIAQGASRGKTRHRDKRIQRPRRVLHRPLVLLLCAPLANIATQISDVSQFAAARPSAVDVSSAYSCSLRRVGERSMWDGRRIGSPDVRRDATRLPRQRRDRMGRNRCENGNTIHRITSKEQMQTVHLFSDCLCPCLRTHACTLKFVPPSSCTYGSHANLSTLRLHVELASVRFYVANDIQ